MFEEGLGFFDRGKTMIQLRIELRGLAVRTVYDETGEQTEIALAFESGNFAFALHNKAHRHALHTTGGKAGAHFVPQHGRKAETYQAIEYATRLLRIYQVEIDRTRMLYGVEDGRFRNFVEYNTARGGRVEFKDFRKVPRDGFSLAVLIGSQPNGLAFLGLRAQIADNFLFVVGNYIDGRKSFRVNAEIFFRQIADVSEAGHDLKVVAEKAFDGLGLRGALHDH